MPATPRTKQPPWTVPVPVRKAPYVSLHPEHAELAVEAFLGGIAAFGATVDGGAQEDLLLCDLQTNPDMSVHGRLGSGRAGVYRGKYLKGVGRTPLAANWANPEDVGHHTGFLRASSAIRELVVSEYLAAKGSAHAINPCEGVLFKPIAPALREHMLAKYRTVDEACASRDGFWSGDVQLQGMSVKKAGFARFSNLVWLGDHLDFFRSTGTSTTTFAAFVRTFLESVEPSAATDDAEPAALAGAFFRAVNRGFGSLRCFWRLGISWSSLHNNFATDGRFLDIDCPVILGTPLLGIIGRSAHRAMTAPHPDMQLGLFEPFVYALHMRMLAWAFAGRLRAIGEMGHPVSRVEREFARQAAAAFTTAGRAHRLFSKRGLTKMLLDWATSEVDLDAPRRRALADVVDVAYEALLSERPKGLAALSLRAMPVPLARLSAANDMVPHVFDFCEAAPVVSEEGAMVNRLLSELCEIRDLDRLLAALGEAKKNISANCKQAPPCRESRP
jgi:hypothetical protein